jgi:hypothetical protein
MRLTAEQRRGLHAGLVLTALGWGCLAGYLFEEWLYRHPLVRWSEYLWRAADWYFHSPARTVVLVAGWVLVPLGLYRIGESASDSPDPKEPEE